MTGLEIIWFLIITFLLAGYVILDGYDLGVGFWYLFSRKEEDRRILLNAIAPYWDGNEVWLVTAGAAFFAAFPIAYASLFSGMYLALMLVVAALIFRAVSIEFRNQSEGKLWRRGWDFAFSIGSIVPALVYGVGAANIIIGMPLDSDWNYTGTFFDLLNPYALLIGVCGLFMIAFHGALFACVKSEGELNNKLRKQAIIAFVPFIISFGISIYYTINIQTHIMANFAEFLILWVFPIGAVVLFLAAFILNIQKKEKASFMSSCFGIGFIFAAMASGIFPNLIYNTSTNPHLTLSSASSTPYTLTVMLIVAGFGMPIVLAYTYFVRKIFRGKATEDAGY